MSLHRRPSLRRAGFTLIELLVVIGIIAVLLGILLPYMGRAQRQAEQARTKNDLAAITQALDNFKGVTGYYPPVPWTTTFPGLPATITDGSQVLYWALCNGFRVRAGGTTYGPYLPPEKYNIINNQVSERNGTTATPTPILYFPASQEQIPNVHAANYVFCHTPTSPSGAFFYTSASDTGTKLNPTTWATILGAGSNGILSSTASPTYTGPFLLWAPGPDKLYGFPTGTTKTDDVTNFDIPSQYRK